MLGEHAKHAKPTRQANTPSQHAKPTRQANTPSQHANSISRDEESLASALLKFQSLDSI
jgi:hypothetical protein